MSFDPTKVKYEDLVFDESCHDLTPCLVNYLERHIGWSKGAINEKLSELIGSNWRELHVWDWGQILEDKGLMKFDEDKSRNCSRPEYMFFSEEGTNEGVGDAIIRLVGYGPNDDRHDRKLHKQFIKRMLDMQRMVAQARGNNGLQ